jgi:hypothetical protein
MSSSFVKVCATSAGLSLGREQSVLSCITLHAEFHLYLEDTVMQFASVLGSRKPNGVPVGAEVGMSRFEVLVQLKQRMAHLPMPVGSQRDDREGKRKEKWMAFFQYQRFGTHRNMSQKAGSRKKRREEVQHSHKSNDG